jgi:hypothetical protein
MGSGSADWAKEGAERGKEKDEPEEKEAFHSTKVEPSFSPEVTE